jgi:hypothetical protein
MGRDVFMAIGRFAKVRGSSCRVLQACRDVDKGSTVWKRVSTTSWDTTVSGCKFSKVVAYLRDESLVAKASMVASVWARASG